MNTKVSDTKAAKKKELKVTEVSFEDFTAIDFVPPSSFYFKTALGTLLFISTLDRNLAQAWCDEYSGLKGKYKIIVTRDVKTKSRREDGGLSVYATATRPKGSSRAPK